MIRIYADFNNTDEDSRVRLDTSGSREDIERSSNELVEGTRVMLYMIDEFEVEGTLVFDKIWRAIPDWGTIRYTPPTTEP